jgi:hypothetical protein
MSEFQTFYPGPGEETEMAQALLALVDEPGQLQTSTDTAGTGHVAFVVPAEVGERYLKDRKDDDDDSPKRRGRPRKATAEATAEGTEGE